jgi:hypothetical protein
MVAHDQIDEISMQQVEDIIVSSIFDVFAGRGTAFENFLSSEDEVSTVGGEIAQHHLPPTHYCINHLSI